MYDEIINENEGGHSHQKLITWPFIIELLVLMVVPVPYFDAYIELTCRKNVKVVYLLSEFLFALMWLRVFFLVRTGFNYSVFRDPLSKKVCQSYGVKSDIFHALKCRLLLAPEKTVMALFLATIFSAAYLVRIFEVPYHRVMNDPVFDSYYQSVWFTVITFSTIGYGDISPGTFPGQVITILLAFWSALLLALLVVTISNIFNLTDNQEMALRHIRLTHQAARVICRGI